MDREIERRKPSETKAIVFVDLCLSFEAILIGLRPVSLSIFGQQLYRQRNGVCCCCLTGGGTWWTGGVSVAGN